MKVTVTGGGGFIGSNLCRSLVESESVTDLSVLDDFSTGSRANLDDLPSVRVVEGSVLDPAALDAVTDGVDVIVHLAALPSVPRSLSDPLASHRTNATGTLQVLEAARRHGEPHVIVASSSSVYGANPALPKREDMVPMPTSPYGASKLAGETAALAHAHAFGLPVLALRFFNVFGPAQPAGHAYAAVVPAFVDRALRNEPLVIHGDGFQTRDFTFVDSVTTVLVDAVVRRVTHPGPVNLAFGTRVSLLELVALLEDILGRPLERCHRAPRTGDVRDSQADQTLLRRLFPDADPVPLEAGLRTTVRWFREGTRQPAAG